MDAVPAGGFAAQLGFQVGNPVLFQLVHLLLGHDFDGRLEVGWQCLHQPQQQLLLFNSVANHAGRGDGFIVLVSFVLDCMAQP